LAHSESALKLAFNIAESHGAQVIVLHSYITPAANTPLQISAALTFDGLSGQESAAQTETAEMIRTEAQEMMEQLRRRLRESIKRGDMPPVKFSTIVTEGVPEECIDRIVKEKNPWCLVMGTRAAHQKERELIGSVSAEVLDTCRTQAITVPEGSKLQRMEQVDHITLLSTYSQSDFLALDAIHRLLPSGQKALLTVVSIPTRRFSKETEGSAARALLEYCMTHYPQFTVELRTPDRSELLEEYERIERSHHIDLMVVPNRKKNVFARLFNPGIAHRVLFHFDIPMMVIPV
ncbi:MAG: universal stress protein, partial [Muribaculaceae bacterium]|nr:universal stress protein [Muribaculaceae bacterium]